MKKDKNTETYRPELLSNFPFKHRNKHIRMSLAMDGYALPFYYRKHFSRPLYRRLYKTGLNRWFIIFLIQLPLSLITNPFLLFGPYKYSYLFEISLLLIVSFAYMWMLKIRHQYKTALRLSNTKYLKQIDLIFKKKSLNGSKRSKEDIAEDERRRAPLN